MFSEKIWDFWSSRYESLLVQRFALTPARMAVLEEVKAYLREIKDVADCISILDMGCGTGQMVCEMEKALSGYKLKITGVDLSKGMIDQALRKKAKSEFICNDAESYNSGKNSFDVIICLNSFPYYKNQEKVLIHFGQLLKKGGLLILSQASVNTIYDKLIMLGVKLTVSHSIYLSFQRVKKLSQKIFQMEPEIKKIPVKWFIPTMGMFLWRKE